jgi:hypothetical protein
MDQKEKASKALHRARRLFQEMGYGLYYLSRVDKTLGRLRSGAREENAELR